VAASIHNGLGLVPRSAGTGQAAASVAADNR